MRYTHSAANEKPLYLGLSIPPIDPLSTTNLPTSFSPLLKSSLSLLSGDLHMAHYGCRLRNAILKILNTPIFAGEITGSLFLGQHYKPQKCKYQYAWQKTGQSCLIGSGKMYVCTDCLIFYSGYSADAVLS